MSGARETTKEAETTGIGETAGHPPETTNATAVTAGTVTEMTSAEPARQTAATETATTRAGVRAPPGVVTSAGRAPHGVMIAEAGAMTATSAPDHPPAVAVTDADNPAPLGGHPLPATTAAEAPAPLGGPAKTTPKVNPVVAGAHTGVKSPTEERLRAPLPKERSSKINE